MDDEEPEEVLGKYISRAIDRLAESVCRPGLPWTTPTGGKVGDLTEAMIFIGSSLYEIAMAVDRLAAAAEDRNTSEIDTDGR